MNYLRSSGMIHSTSTCMILSTRLSTFWDYFFRNTFLYRSTTYTYQTYLGIIEVLSDYYLVVCQLDNPTCLCCFQRRRCIGIWQNHLRLVVAAALVSGAAGQCFGGVETYEKTSGTTVVCDEGASCTSKGLLTQPDTSVTRDCIAICKQSGNCNSFTVGRSHCL